MSASARLKPATRLALLRYCRAHGLTRTQALEKGIALLLEHGEERTKHPAFLAFERLRGQLAEAAAQGDPRDSTRTLKQHLDEKYPA